MRTLALSILLLAACDKDEPKHADASVKVIDAPPADAAVDAAPDARPDAPADAPNMDVVTACMHACDAIATCVMQPPDPDCYMGCQEDLADCTAQQVATIDACSTEMCGDIKGKMSPLLDCIIAVSCVDMATSPLSPK
jgi:hypothetical protein